MNMLKRLCMLVFVGMGQIISPQAQYDGFIDNEEVVFPIGFYEHPRDLDALKRMAEHGVNIVHCHNKSGLDQAAEAGLLGIVPLPLQNGVTDELKNTVMELKDHPALAVWEGPDEVVWNFTAYSGLHRSMGVHKEEGEWWKQTENAVQYAEQKANEIIPNMQAAVEWIQSVDDVGHPFWMNEALRSDMMYVRQYLDFIDIVGCDIYPVKHDDRRLHRMAAAIDRWNQVGRGKSVWMVLQAFSWSEIDDRYKDQEPTYPSFAESRFMAYCVIAHGAAGIQYWGSAYTKSDAFRQSLYALTAEISMLQPFLTGTDHEEMFALVIDNPDAEEESRGVWLIARQVEEDWLIVLVNEDNRWHNDVEVIGLDEIEDKTQYLLYENTEKIVRNGELLTRIPPYGVQVFCTSRKWETDKREGRVFQ